MFQHGWWSETCAAAGHESLALPVASHPSGNAYAADLAGRIDNGPAVVEALEHQSVDLLLDNGGTGLAFLHNTGGATDLKLAHETAGRVLCSHFIDPLSTAFQGLDWPTLWQCLQSGTWVKAIWDRAQVAELQRFGVPNVVHLPMAAVDQPYNTEPLDPSRCEPIVSFVGGQNTSYFSRGVSVPADSLFAGTLAHAVRGDLAGTSFYDVFFNLYGLGAEPVEGDDAATRAAKVATYFNAKLFYHAALCVRNRDRFVIFLKRHLGDRFRLTGRGWDTTYGLPTAPRIETADAYFDHFRRTAINLNLVNGNAETGLNMRHFEITAAGGFMLCYDQPELSECFEIGTECAVFRSESELVERIDYYLAHPEERVAIAAAGQKRTLSQHLYRHRLASLLQMVQTTRSPVEFSSKSVWETLAALVPAADVVLDCGAHVGQTARSLRRLYPDATIYSFEPVSALFSQLETMCRQIDVSPVNKAVGDLDGTVEINLTAGSEANSLLGFLAGNPCARWTKEVGHETVEVCTLDRWCQDSGIDPRRVDILKLDVQGAELKALYGARRLLDTVPVIYLEVAFVPIYKDGPLFAEIDRFLGECGYRRHAVFASDQPQNWGDAIYVRVKSEE
ncbi:MAG: FkbM family methyltransferase [Phycisphaerae bacterium]